LQIQLIIILMLVFPNVILCQDLTLQTNLPTQIKETSGLILLNQQLVTHNDSGGEPELYEIDSLTGAITRTVVVSNATNQDWEEICLDDSYIYIGDFGNNNGSRTNLMVYRIPISDYLTTTNDTVVADTILFDYSDQVDFTPTTFSTNFDGEAMIAYNDSLYIFSKNWGNSRTNIYSLPKVPGTYSINRVDSLDSQGLVCGATIDTNTNKIVLIGYSFVSSFIVEIDSFLGNNFSDGVIERNLISNGSGALSQTEAIAFSRLDHYFASAEETSGDSAALYKMEILEPSSVPLINRIEIEIFPNPSAELIHVNCKGLIRLELYNIQCQLTRMTHEQSISVKGLRAGTYLLRAFTVDGQSSLHKVMVK
jgi:hypothetical protein